jgi:hypothetical protein
LKRILASVLACIALLPTMATSQSSQTKQKRPAIASKQKRSAAASKKRPTVVARNKRTSAKTAQDTSVDVQTGRGRVAGQIKVLTQFIYLLGGIAKGIESVDLAAHSHEVSAAAVEQNERNKVKVKESIKNVREGLDRLESDFLGNPGLKSYYPYVSGVARIAESAETQAAANRFDEAGRLLLRAVTQLADALALMR